MKSDTQTILDLMNVIEALLKAHCYISDWNCEHVDCECLPCLEARELLERLAGKVSTP